PLLITCDDLAEVILAISANSDAFQSAFVPEQFDRTSFADKNKDNGLSSDLANYIRRKFIPKFADVKKFLAMPENEHVLERYESAAQELEEQITLHRTEYAKFDDVLVRIMQLLFTRDGDLSRKKAL